MSGISPHIVPASPTKKGWGKSPHPSCQLPCIRSAGQSQELRGVRRRAALADLEMQVAPRRAAGPADFPDLCAPQHHVADLYRAFRCMRVTRNEVVAVVDFDHITILRMEF